MTSITWEKSNLRGLIADEATKRYHALSEADREIVFTAAVNRWTGKLTLKELQQVVNGYALPILLREQELVKSPQ